MLPSAFAGPVSRMRISTLPVLIIAFWSVLSTCAASGQTLNTLVNFNAADGSGPATGLVADAKGDLFGTTREGGASGVGTVFEVPYDAVTGTYASSPTTLVTFNYANGAFPGGLILDVKGNLFGTTFGGGGQSGIGTVFEIPYDAVTGTYATSPLILVTFDGTNGEFPVGSMLADANGNLFGVTEGGPKSVGSVFEILHNASTGTYATAPTTLVTFNFTDGGYPQAGLVADASGNLFGTTTDGGPLQLGTVYEIPFNAKTHSYATSPTTLVDFNDANGSRSYANLIIDANGDLFGTTIYGGAFGLGTVFELPYNAKTHSYPSSPTTLVSFNGSNGAEPVAGLIADANGNLFGTTTGGTVFEVVKTATGYASTPNTLVFFDGTNGQRPYAGLIAGSQGDLFGTTVQGGSTGDGTVFEIVGSGFSPSRKFEGTPGSTGCFGVSISTLTHTYGGLAHAAASLGYSSVVSLQSAVKSYCGK